MSLALTTKLASPSPILNALGAEIALDLELLDIDNQFVTHTPGKLLVIADALSRLFAPGGDSQIPKELESAKRRPIKARDDAFFRVWSVCNDPLDA